MIEPSAVVPAAIAAPALPFLPSLRQGLLSSRNRTDQHPGDEGNRHDQESARHFSSVFFRLQKLKRSILLLLKMNGAPSLTSSSRTSILPRRPASISVSPRLTVLALRALDA